MGLEQTLMTKISAKAEQNKIAAVLDKADHVQAYLAMNGLQKRADFNSTMNALGDWAKANPEAAGGIAGLLGGGALGGILGRGWRGALTGGLLGGAAGAGSGYMYRNMNDAQQQAGALKAQNGLANMKNKAYEWAVKQGLGREKKLQNQLTRANQAAQTAEQNLATEKANAAKQLELAANKSEAQLRAERVRQADEHFAQQDAANAALREAQDRNTAQASAIADANAKLTAAGNQNKELSALNERLMGTPQKDWERGQDLARLETEASTGNTGALAQLKRIVAAADEAGALGRQQKATTAAANVAGAQARSDTLASLREQQQALQNDPELQRALKLIEQRNKQQAKLQAQIQALNGGVK